MNIEETLQKLIKEIKNSPNLNHTSYIIRKYFDDETLSLKKKRKLFFLTLEELKKMRKKLRKTYISSKKEQNTKINTNEILRLEDLYKKKIHLLKIFYHELELEKMDRQEKITISITHPEKEKQPVSSKQQEIEEMNQKCQYYLSCFENKKPVVIDDVDNFVMAYKYFIRNYHLIDYQDVILEYTNQLVDVLTTFSDYDLIVCFNSILDNIKYRNCELDKNYENDLLEKEILKKVKKKIKQTFKNFSYKQIQAHDYRYDILEHFITHDGNYYYLKSLINQMPDIINIRSSSKEHILVKVVQLFIYNLEIELRNQDSDFISHNYYKNIYCLLQNQKNLELNKSDQDIISTLLDNMIDHVSKHHYEEQRKSKALADLNEVKENINPHHFKEKKHILDSQLQSEIELLPLRRKQVLEEKDRVDLTSTYLNQIKEKIETISIGKQLTQKQLAKILNISNSDVTNSFDFSKTIMFEGDRFAYSITRDPKYNSYFRIHTLDLACLLESNSMISNYLYNQIFNPDDFHLSSFLKIRQDEIIPVITYQFKVLPNGYVSNFHIFNSKISVDHIYRNKDLEVYRKDEQLKEFVRIYRMLNPFDDSYLTIQKYDEFASSMIINNLLNYVYSNQIPFVIQGKEDTTQMQYLELNKGLCYILSKLDQKTFKQISNIIYQNQNESHYSISSFDFENHINLLGPINYEYLFNQRIIKEIIKHTGSEIIKDHFQLPCEELVQVLNNSVSYVDISQEMKSSYSKKR